MNRVDKNNYYLDIADTVPREERVLGVISAQSSSKTMKSYQQVMSVRRGAERIVPTSDTVQGKNLKFRAAKDTSFAAAFTPKRTVSFRRHAVTR